MATHSRTVAWRLPWTLEPGRLQPMGSQRDVTVSDTTDMTQHTCKKQKAFSNGLKSESGSVASSSLRPCGLYSPWNSPGQNTGWGSPSLLQGNLPNPGIEPRSPALQADSLPAEPPGKLNQHRLSGEPLPSFPTSRWGRGHVACQPLLKQATTHLRVNLHFSSWCLAGEKSQMGFTGLKSGCLPDCAPRLGPPSTPRPAAATEPAQVSLGLGNPRRHTGPPGHLVLSHLRVSRSATLSHLHVLETSGDTVGPVTLSTPKGYTVDIS